jgi:Tol biopolymer transport system component
MALAPGARLGPYEVVSAIAAGGMGEVYRARDTRLGRTVALKVLPPALADDQEFQRRFHGEAKAISQLTHPNICTLHDVGEQDGTTFLVMEYVAGETLAKRLARGAVQTLALPLDVSLQIAIQIADALAAAHQRGIVHRDLKPGNIMLAKSSASQGVPHVKLLDFGLAKSGMSVVKSTADAAGAAATHATELTRTGLIVGTLPYMAPEQIEGGQIDARTDIFAFGSVVYEMLTGRKAFEGKTQASLMAAILERDPPSVAAWQPRVPALAEAAIRKCLAKSPDERWQSAADLATALRWIVAQPASSAGDGRVAVSKGRRRLARILAISALCLGLLAAGGLGTWRYLRSQIAPVETTRFELTPPGDAMFSPAPVATAAQLALSPDGRRLAFVAAARRGRAQVWIRTLDSVLAQALAGTEGASFPFWSPDSRSVAFFADGKLKRTDLAGGAPQTIADAPNGRGGSWGPGGNVVFTPTPNGPLYRVSAVGGTAAQETSLRADEEAVTHYWPEFLPDGRRFLYYQRSREAIHQGIYVKTLGSPDAVRVLGTNGRSVYSAGHLLFMRDAVLFAIPFDLRTLRTSGEPARVADHVGYFGGTMGYVAVTASASTLAHGPGVLQPTTLQWRDRSGQVVGSLSVSGVYRSPRLSPDGQSVAVAMVNAQDQSPDIYVLESLRGGSSRVTSHPSNDWFPVWSADGRRLIFSSTRAGSSALFQKPPSAAGDGDQVVPTAYSGMYPTDASRDGQFVIYHQVTAAAGYDINFRRLDKPDESVAFLSSRFNEAQARFSPNGRWVAYASDQSGRFQVYVRPFPPGTGEWAISAEGGTQPEWRHDGKELFFLSGDGAMMALDVAAEGPAFTAGAPHKLFEVEVPENLAPYHSDYAVSRDGRRFLVNTITDQPISPKLTVILNWTTELPRR